MANFAVDDCVHGRFELSAYVQEIIDTDVFKRLRNVAQLSGVSYVFKSANHNRFDHSLGTAFLCQRLLQTLEKNQGHPIDELHKKCVILAGLLHDLGHGPFSHLWEGVVHQGPDKDWTHEEQSANMIRHLLASNNIRLDPQRHDFALRLMTSLITGDKEAWQELLKPQEMFITEIVNNVHCRIDVDKIDYILRDTHHLEGSITIEPFVNFLNRARIMTGSDGISHIAYHEDDFWLIENLFFNRALLTKNIYIHHQVTGCVQMIIDICYRASEGGVEISDFPLTEVHMDAEAYLQLDDSVLDVIEASKIDNPEIHEAKEILKNLKQGNFYQMVDESLDESSSDVERILSELSGKYGGIFFKVPKRISSAEVPANVPLYNEQLQLVEKTSNMHLSYESTRIYCKKAGKVAQVKNFIKRLKDELHQTI